jgi:hypothetical protein
MANQFLNVDYEPQDDVATFWTWALAAENTLIEIHQLEIGYLEQIAPSNSADVVLRHGASRESKAHFYLIASAHTFRLASRLAGGEIASLDPQITADVYTLRNVREHWDETREGLFNRAPGELTRSARAYSLRYPGVDPWSYAYLNGMLQHIGGVPICEIMVGLSRVREWVVSSFGDPLRNPS